jgi:hypothetical protein
MKLRLDASIVVIVLSKTFCDIAGDSSIMGKILESTNYPGVIDGYDKPSIAAIAGRQSYYLSKDIV